MNNATVPEGLVLEVEEATFTLGGNIGIRNARLKAAGKDLPPLCFIRRLDAHFKLGSLLMGNFVPTDASIEDAWCLAADQERSPALENFSGTLHFREEIIRFAFEGRALSSRLDFRGLWNTEKAFPRRVPRKKTSILLRQDFSEMYWQAIKWSEKAKALLAKAEQPIIGAYITVEDQCNIRLLAESGVIKLGSYEAESVHCSTKAEMNEGKDIEGSLLLVASKLYLDSGNEKIGIGQIRARVDGFKCSSQEITELPIVDAKLEGLSLSGKFEGRLPSVHLEASPSGQDSFALFAAMGTNESKIIFTGTSQPWKTNAEGVLTISVQPHDLTSATIKEWAKKQILLTPNPITATIGPLRLQDGNFSGSKFIIKAKELIVRNSPPASYSIHGKVNPDGSILAHDIYGRLKHSEVRGSFRQNWSNLDFRFLLEGRCMPTEINPWLKDWWDVIWQDFSWSQDIPYCDFDIKGQWLNRKKRTRTYGTVEVSNISYRDLPLDKGSLKVIVNEKKTRITEINLFPPTGKVEGNLSFPRSSSNQPLILGFDLKGEMNPTHCRRAFGPVAEKALTRFDTNSTVKVTAKGQVLLANDINRSDNEDLTHFRIHVAAHNPIRFSRMPLEYLSLDLQSSADQTHIEKLDFGIAGGRGSGSLLFREEQNGSELDIKLSVQKVNRSSFVEAMTLSDAFSEDKNPSQQDPSEKLTSGILDFSLEASGRTDEIWSFEGNGSLLIRDPALGRVRIFGSLSDLIGQNSLGSVRFTKLDTPFILTGERATFKNLNLSGPASLLVANGEVNLSQGLLDFEARLHLLGNIPLVSKLTQLADPLSALGNIKIGGSFDEPTWHVQFRPGKAPLEVLFPDGLPPPRKPKGD
ncbi:MAG: hypothetical protein OSB39_06225 [Opitutales bacterium]|nr:hypothetical protein [Opitutales bacterium]